MGVWVEISHRRVNAQHKKTKRWVEYTEREREGGRKKRGKARRLPVDVGFDREIMK